MKNIFTFSLMVNIIMLYFSQNCNSQGVWINDHNSNMQNDDQKAYLHIFNDNNNWDSIDGLVFPVNSQKPSAGADQQGMVMYLDIQSTADNANERGLNFYYNNNWYPILSQDNYETNFKSLSVQIERLNILNPNDLNANFPVVFKSNSYVHNDPVVFQNSTQLTSDATAGKYQMQMNLNFSVIGKSSGTTNPSLATLECYKNDSSVGANFIASSSVNIPNPGKNGVRHSALSLSKIVNLNPGDKLIFVLNYKRQSSDVFIYNGSTTGSVPSSTPNPLSGVMTILNLN